MFYLYWQNSCVFKSFFQYIKKKFEYTQLMTPFYVFLMNLKYLFIYLWFPIF